MYRKGRLQYNKQIFNIAYISFTIIVEEALIIIKLLLKVASILLNIEASKDNLPYKATIIGYTQQAYFNNVLRVDQ